MVRIALLALCAVCVACQPLDQETLRDDILIVQAVFTSGSPAQRVQVLGLNPANGQPEFLDKAQITLISGGERFVSWNPEQGSYVCESVNSTPGLTAEIEVSADGMTARAEVVFPEIPVVANETNPMFPANPDQPGSVAYIAEWSHIPGFEYVLSLECLEENPVEIPFDVPSGRFSERLDGPQVQSGVVILNTDFKYYGQHRLTIHAVNQDYRDFYFFRPQSPEGLIVGGPDNVDGGRGFVTAVSRLEVNLVVEE